MFLVDSDILIDILRGYGPALAWQEGIQDETIVLSGVVVMELIQGCRNKFEVNRILKFVSTFPVIWQSQTDCERALSHFAQNYLKHNLNIPDAFIGETAVGLGIPLYTFNKKHFEAIPGLIFYQPYQKPTN